MRGVSHGSSYGPRELFHYAVGSQDWQKSSCRPQSRVQFDPAASGKIRESAIEHEIRILLNRRWKMEQSANLSLPAPAAGHGRNGAQAYRGAHRIAIPHASLHQGDRCPECQRGKVYPLHDPGLLVRMRGQAPIAATLYELEKLHCNLCGEVFTANVPEAWARISTTRQRPA